MLSSCSKRTRLLSTPVGGASEGKDECMSPGAAAAALAMPPISRKKLLPAEAAAASISLEEGGEGRNGGGCVEA